MADKNKSNKPKITSEVKRSNGIIATIFNTSHRTASVGILIAAVFTPLDLLALATTVTVALYICLRIRAALI
jgi:hypothetical protein